MPNHAARRYDRLGMLIPDGYEVVKTDRCVPHQRPAFFPLRWLAERHRRGLDNDSPLFRYVVQETNRGLPVGIDVSPLWARWVVVAKQNALRPRDE